MKTNVKNYLLSKKYLLSFVTLSLALIIAFSFSVSAAQNAHNEYPSTAEGKGSNNCAITVWEGETVKPQLVAHDPDENQGVGPAGKIIWAYFSPLDNNGIWVTKQGDAGIYNTKVTVNDGQYSDELDFCIEVLRKNQPPVAKTMYYRVYQGDIVKVVPEIIDPDSPQVKVLFPDLISPDGIFHADKVGNYQMEYKVIDNEFEVKGLIIIDVLPRTVVVPAPVTPVIPPIQPPIQPPVEVKNVTLYLDNPKPDVYITKIVPVFENKDVPKPDVYITKIVPVFENTPVIKPTAVVSVVRNVPVIEDGSMVSSLECPVPVQQEQIKTKTVYLETPTDMKNQVLYLDASSSEPDCAKGFLGWNQLN